jgi:hypothetical protein
LAQAINYLEAYNLKVGLLINFGSKRLQFKKGTAEIKKGRNVINDELWGKVSFLHVWNSDLVD